MSNQLPIPTGNKLKFGEIKKKNLKKKKQQQPYRALFSATLIKILA